MVTRTHFAVTLYVHCCLVMIVGDGVGKKRAVLRMQPDSTQYWNWGNTIAGKLNVNEDQTVTYRHDIARWHIGTTMHGDISARHCTVTCRHDIAQWYIGTTLHSDISARHCTVTYRHDTARWHIGTTMHDDISARHCTVTCRHDIA